MLPPVEEVTKVLRYEPETGQFFWLIDRGWAGRFKAGSQAGTLHGPRGYLRMSIGGRNYYAHRLAWLIVHGQEPSGVIDHINGNGGDNRIANLRDVSQRENSLNSKKKKNNTSGFKGVSRDHSRMFRATIWHLGKQIYIGSFPTEELAYAAYCETARKLHGEFARLA